MKREDTSPRKRGTAKQTRRPQQKDALPAAAKDAIASGRQMSLLSLEMQGWRLKGSWPRLFNLYTKGKNVRVELSHELNLVTLRIKRNLFPTEAECIIFARGLQLLALLAQTKTAGQQTNTFGFSELKELLLDDFVSMLAPRVLEVLSAKKESDAANARDKAVGLMRSTMNSLIRERFPTKPRATKDNISKEWLAVYAARDLVYETRKLPTKTALKQRLQLLGVDFSKNSKSYNAKWDGLFKRSGLESLPQ
jgi:hypothetical protein